MVVDANWRRDLDRWPKPFLAALSHPAWRKACPLQIAGLIGPEDRNSVQPKAARTDEVGDDQLHHRVATGVWDSTPLKQALLHEADRLVGDQAGFLVLDDTVMPKEGRHSVGVAPHYASSLAKTAHCRALGSVTRTSRERPMLAGLRLFPPEGWTADPERIHPATEPGRSRKHHIPTVTPVSAQAALAGETWRKVGWRRGGAPVGWGAGLPRLEPACGRHAHSACGSKQSTMGV